MADGIAQSACVVVFLTESYMKKAAGLGSKGDDDNARFEFNLACSPLKGVAKIIPVVMEPQCLAQTAWQPLFLGKLGGKEYIDLARDNDEAASGEKHFDAGVGSLIASIKAMPGSLVGAAAAAAPAAQGGIFVRTGHNRTRGRGRRPGPRRERGQVGAGALAHALAG